MTVLHNIHVLKGGEVVGIQGTRLYSPYKEIGVSRFPTVAKAMNVTKRAADISDGIPSATDFEIDYGSRKTEAHRNSAEKEKIENLRKRSSFLFVHPLIFTFFGGNSKFNTKDTLKRIIDLLTHPTMAVGGGLDQSTELFQFIWAADNGFMKPVTLTEAPESDELEAIQSVSTANFQRAESDKINGRKHGEPDYKAEDVEEEDDEEQKEEKEEKEEDEEKKWEKDKDGPMSEWTAQKKKEIPNPE